MARKKKKHKGDEMTRSGRVRTISFVYEEDPDLLDEANEYVINRQAKTARSVLREFFQKALKRENLRLKKKESSIKKTA